MIPHHQVAIDISLLLQKKTQNPIMLNILRILIWTQQYEIDLMKNMLNHFPDKMTSDDKMRNIYTYDRRFNKTKSVEYIEYIL